MKSEFDVVIVGAGAAGALCAWKLSRDKNRSILLLDAGDNGLDDKQRAQFVQVYATSAKGSVLVPYGKLPSKAFVPSPDTKDTGAKETDYYFQPKADDVTPKDPATDEIFKSNYVRILGGSTWAWRGNCPRLIPNDFRLKTKYGVGVDWPIAYGDLEPYYCEAERELGVSGNDEEWDGLLDAWRGNPFPMPNIALAYGDRLIKTALDGKVIDGKTLKVVSTPQARNSRRYEGRSECLGNSNCIPICPSGAKYDAGVHLQKLAKERPNVEIRSVCVVTKLEATPNGRIEKVVYRSWKTAKDADVVVQGKTVVLALNGIETPRLLLHSGLANGSGIVGNYLMDHVQEDVVAVPEPLYQFRGPQNICSIEVFRDGDFRKTNGAFRMTVGNDGGGRRQSLPGVLDRLMWPPRSSPEQERLELFGKGLRTAFRNRAVRLMRISYSTEQLPNRDNRVRLNWGKLDAFGVPEPKIHYGIDDYSRRALVYAHSVAQRIFERIPGAEGITPLQPAFEYNGAGHIMGTCRMGDDPANSVVDRDGRAHDHPNLFIAGSSVLPTGGTANPTLTLAALALRTAEAI